MHKGKPNKVRKLSFEKSFENDSLNLPSDKNETYAKGGITPYYNDRETAWLWVNPDNQVLRAPKLKHMQVLQRYYPKISYDYDLMADTAMKDGWVRVIYEYFPSDSKGELSINGYEEERVRFVLKEIFSDIFKYGYKVVFVEWENPQGDSKAFSTFNSEGKQKLMRFVYPEKFEEGGVALPSVPSKKELAKILREHPLIKYKGDIQDAYIVGSFAKGAAHKDSDIDILLKVNPVEGMTSEELERAHRRKLQQYFIDNNIEGIRNDLHPQWDGRRIDLYFTYDDRNDDAIKLEDGGLVSPTGKPSNLTPEQYKLVRTPAFKAWFGDWENDPENASKVVDENGEPLVVYHGTDKKFTVFKDTDVKRNTMGDSVGFYFTPSSWAASRMSIWGEYLSVFLNIKNLVKLNKFTNDDDWVELLGEEIKKASGLPDRAETYWFLKNGAAYRGASHDNVGIVVKELSEKKGIQGYYFPEYMGDDIKIVPVFVVFNSENVKLADGSNTTFDAANPDIRFEDGGVTNNIICQKCGWSWSKDDSNPADETVCHKCGYDNKNLALPDSYASPETLKRVLNEQGYDIIKTDDMSIFKKPLSVAEIAQLHGVSEEEVNAQLKKGTAVEMEHTDNVEVAKIIALHHLAEAVSYYNKLEIVERTPDILENNIDKEYEAHEYIAEQKAEADALLTCSDSKLYKAMICKTKIEVAQRNEETSDSGEIQNVWNEVKNIWTRCLNDLIDGNFTMREVKDADCGCGKYARGGLAYGNSHAKGGIPAEISSSGQHIEFEGGEGIINKRSMQMEKKVEFQGKQMTPCEVISKINEMGGGVKFKCADVKEIIAEDGKF